MIQYDTYDDNDGGDDDDDDGDTNNIHLVLVLVLLPVLVLAFVLALALVLTSALPVAALTRQPLAARTLAVRTGRAGRREEGGRSDGSGPAEPQGHDLLPQRRAPRGDDVGTARFLEAQSGKMCPAPGRFGLSNGILK